MKMIINLFCDGPAYAGDPFELAKTGPGDRSRRAEMMQKRLLATRPDSSNLLERRVTERFCPLGTVGADREAVRLVTQALEKVEDGIARVERERCPTGNEEALAPSVAVGPLGDCPNRNVIDAELVQYALRDVKLSLAAVDQHQIGPATPIAFGILLERPGKAALQHLVHHRVVVTTGIPLFRPCPGLPGRVREGSREDRDEAVLLRRRKPADGEFSIGVLDQPVRPGDDHCADRVRALDVAVVVDLDAVERTVEAEGGGDAVE